MIWIKCNDIYTGPGIVQGKSLSLRDMATEPSEEPLAGEKVSYFVRWAGAPTQYRDGQMEILSA